MVLGTGTHPGRRRKEKRALGVERLNREQDDLRHHRLGQRQPGASGGGQLKVGVLVLVLAIRGGNGLMRRGDSAVALRAVLVMLRRVVMREAVHRLGSEKAQAQEQGEDQAGCADGTGAPHGKKIMP